MVEDSQLPFSDAPEKDFGAEALQARACRVQGLHKVQFIEQLILYIYIHIYILCTPYIYSLYNLYRGFVDGLEDI